MNPQPRQLNLKQGFPPDVCFARCFWPLFHFSVFFLLFFRPFWTRSTSVYLHLSFCASRHVNYNRRTGTLFIILKFFFFCLDRNREKIVHYNISFLKYKIKRAHKFPIQIHSMYIQIHAYFKKKRSFYMKKSPRQCEYYIFLNYDEKRAFL